MITKNFQIGNLHLTESSKLIFLFIQPTTSSVLRTITHDIPIRIIPSRLWNEYQEQGIPEFAASFYLPPLRTIKPVIERMKNISNVLVSNLFAYHFSSTGHWPMLDFKTLHYRTTQQSRKKPQCLWLCSLQQSRSNLSINVKISVETNLLGTSLFKMILAQNCWLISL